MIGWGLVTGKGMLPKGSPVSVIIIASELTFCLIAYPWGSLAEGTTICDLGGGNGHATLDLLKKFPQLRIVLQDLESVVEEGRKVRIFYDMNIFILANVDPCQLWSTEYPEVVENKHVSFVPIDFFKETPVPGSDFYYVRFHSLEYPCRRYLHRLQLRHVMYEGIIRSTLRYTHQSL